MQNDIFNASVPVAEESEERSRRRQPFVSIAQTIGQFALRSPDHLAIISDRGCMTYKQLVNEAASFANRLKSRSCLPGSIVAVATGDAVKMIIAALGSWMIDCAYMPMDPEGPPERLYQCLVGVNARVLATSEATLLQQRAADPWMLLPLDTEDVGLTSSYLLPQQCPAWSHDSEQVAYVIYTSGSTGYPKGVAISQGNLAYLAHWHKCTFHTTPEDYGSQFAALSFDASVLEIWPLLAAGAILRIFDRTIALTPDHLRDSLVENHITICFAATPIAERLLRLDWPQEPRLRLLLTGADTLRMFPPPSIPFQLVNNYGPTECTVLATSGFIPPQTEPTGLPDIGSPIDGTATLLLDEDLIEVPDGDRGQIAICGPGVGRYIGQRSDTEQRRFTVLPQAPMKHVYLTGDLGRRLSNGHLEFCGRIDYQIKIRGYRIEPEEIAAALQRNAAIREAVVVATNSGENAQLAAYVVLQGEINAADLRTYLGAHLPSYMIPDYFVRLLELPVNQSGKVNRDALPPPNRSNVMESDDAIADLKTEIQTQIASILSTLLEGREIGLNDNFFRLGGHSLLAAQLLTRLQSAFTVQLSLRTVFECPTVKHLSNIIERHILDVLAAPSGDVTGAQIAK